MSNEEARESWECCARLHQVDIEDKADHTATAVVAAVVALAAVAAIAAVALPIAEQNAAAAALDASRVQTCQPTS